MSVWIIQNLKIKIRVLPGTQTVPLLEDVQDSRVESSFSFA